MGGDGIALSEEAVAALGSSALGEVIQEMRKNKTPKAVLGVVSINTFHIHRSVFAEVQDVCPEADL